MTDLMFDHLGIWAVVEREKSGLEDLGFYNCYAGIDKLKCLVVRLDNFEKETMQLGVTRMHKLFVSDKERFAMELEKIDKLIKNAKEIYRGIENKKNYNLAYFKSLTPEKEVRLKKSIDINEDIKKVLKIAALQESINTVVRNSSKPLYKIINDGPIDDIELFKMGKRYTEEEDEYIINNFLSLPVKDIAIYLDRTIDAVIGRIKRLRAKGRI